MHILIVHYSGATAAVILTQEYIGNVKWSPEKWSEKSVFSLKNPADMIRIFTDHSPKKTIGSPDFYS